MSSDELKSAKIDSLPASVLERFLALESKSLEKDHQIERLTRQLLEVKASNDEARALSQRRQSIGIPSTTLLSTSSLTEPAFSSPQRLRGRSSVSFEPLVNEMDSAAEMDGNQSGESDSDSDASPVRRGQRGVKSKRDEESSVIRKAMSHMKAPTTFSGETNAEKDRVEQWVKSVNFYLLGQFGKVEAPQPRWIVVRNLLTGAALDWADAMYSEGVVKSWAEMQPLFIEHIRGSRDSKEEAREAMRTIAFGKGKCRDLRSYNAEFEAIRVRLYPSSSVHLEMNAQAAHDYVEGIRRGHHEFGQEIRRGLISNRQPGVSPTLAEVKMVADRAWEICCDQVRGRSQSSRDHSSPSSSKPFRPYQHSSSQTTVNHMDVDGADESDVETSRWERQESEQEQAAVQTVNTRSPNNRLRGGGDRAPQPERRGHQLTEKELKQLYEAKRCFTCYSKDHQSRKCPSKGKPQRAPTVEQLNA
jgi:hypothetical protein